MCNSYKVIPLLILATFGAAAVAAPPATPSGAARSGGAQVAPGGINRADYLRKVEADFAGMDKDRDGKVTQAEIEDFRAAATIARMRARNSAVFAGLDKDKNGVLSAEEFAALQRPPVAVSARPVMLKLDVNKDQSVSLSEFRDGAIVDFNRLDRNRDSIISAGERTARVPPSR